MGGIVVMRFGENALTVINAVKAKIEEITPGLPQGRGLRRCRQSRTRAASRAAVAEMFALLMGHPLVDLIITSRFGGISSCDVFIRGLVTCLRQRRGRCRG